MIFGPSDAEFRVELAGAEKCVHQNPPKDRASNGKTGLTLGSYHRIIVEIDFV